MSRKFSLNICGPEDAFLSLRRRIPRSTVICFVSTFILGLLIHMNMFVNKLPNLDDTWYLLGSDYGVASGRWLLPSILGLDGDLSMSWVIGVISVTLLSVSACLATSVLRIRRPLPRILAGALMVSFPTVASTFTYMFSADAYFLSLLLACLGAYLTVKYRFGFVGGIIAVALSLGIYQSYLGVAAVLLVAALILETLDGSATVKQLLLRGVKYLLTLALGVALYYLIVKLTTQSEQLVDYMGISSMGEIPAAKLPELIGRAYKSYYNFYIYDQRSLHFDCMTYVFTLMGLACLILGILILKIKKLGALRTVLLLVLLIIAPLAGAIIYVTSTNDYVHDLMIYGLCFLLIAPLVLYEFYRRVSPIGGKSTLGSISCWIIAGALTLTVYNYGILSNEVYFHQQVTYEQTVSYSTRLISAIESFEGYDENIDVVLMGKALAYVDEDHMPEPEVPALTGVLNSKDNINSYSYGNFLRYFMGMSNNVYATESPIAKELWNDSELDSIPCYPDEGSIFMKDGRIVVKLSQLIK